MTEQNIDELAENVNDMIDDKLREEYLRERELLIKIEGEQSHSFDKAMLTLAAGGFLLSISLLELLDKIFEGVICFKYLLVLTWSSFSISLFSITLSFLLSQSAFRRQRDILDNKIMKNTEDSERNVYSTVTKILNVSSTIFFISGAIFMVVFASLNI